MNIETFKLINYRNYSSLFLKFSKYKNFIIGNNGSGKTNIIEAIYYLALTKSFRINNDLALIKSNEQFSTIEGNIKDSVIHKYKIVINSENRKISINDNLITKLGDYISLINVILFNPEDLKLIKDNPSVHRKLFNMELSTFNNNYLKTLSVYNKILKQRNTYLKSMAINDMIPKQYLDISTEKLIDYCIKINQIRMEYINNINDYLNSIFNSITAKDGLVLKYISQYSGKNKDQLIGEYRKNFKRDLNYGKTNIGVHIDDFIFYYNDSLAKEFLSEGEQKNAIIALKLSEVKYCQEKIGKNPILMLDDLFSELDRYKINNIINFLENKIQIFITTTDIHKINKNLLKNCKVFKINKDEVKEQDYE